MSETPKSTAEKPETDPLLETATYWLVLHKKPNTCVGCALIEGCVSFLVGPLVVSLCAYCAEGLWMRIRDQLHPPRVEP